jgi:hypothetical protein
MSAHGLISITVLLWTVRSLHDSISESSVETKNMTTRSTGLERPMIKSLLSRVEEAKPPGVKA